MGNFTPKSSVPEDVPSLPSMKVNEIKVDGKCIFINCEKNGLTLKFQVTFISRFQEMGDDEIKTLIKEEIEKYMMRTFLPQELTIDRESCTFIIKRLE
jgi:hypothetical protein